MTIRKDKDNNSTYMVYKTISEQNFQYDCRINKEVLVASFKKANNVWIVRPSKDYKKEYENDLKRSISYHFGRYVTHTETKRESKWVKPTYKTITTHHDPECYEMGWDEEETVIDKPGHYEYEDVKVEKKEFVPDKTPIKIIPIKEKKNKDLDEYLKTFTKTFSDELIDKINNEFLDEFKKQIQELSDKIAGLGEALKNEDEE